MILVVSLSCVQLFTTPRPVARQTLCPWDAPGKNTGVGCHFLLQGMFLTQRPNITGILCHLSHQGTPKGMGVPLKKLFIYLAAPDLSCGM